MARIPDASALGEPVIARGRAVPYEDRSGEIVARAIGQTARQVGQAVEQFAAHDDQFNYARAKSALLSADIDARKSLENDQDWGSYEKRYTEVMGKARESAAGLIRGKRSKTLFDEDAKFDVERGLGQIRAQARTKEVDWGRASLGEVLEANRSAALSAGDEQTRASFLMGTQDAIQGALGKGYISAQEAVRHRQSWSESYAEGALDTLPYAKQVDMLKAPKGTPAAFLPPDRRANLLREAENALRLERERAEADQRAGMIETRQALSDQLRDITVAAQMGLPISVPSRSVLHAAFGEREGEQRYQLANKAASLSGDVASLQQLSTEDIVKRVDSYKPTQAEGAADQAQLYGMLAGSANKIMEARATDPAGYLAQHAPKTQSAWEAFQEDGSEATRDAYFAAVDADRERLGLPKGDILPNAYAKSLVKEIANPKSAEQLASLMEGEAQKWGDRWPDVHAQIAKDLPDMAAVIGSGIDRSAAVTLASTAKLKKSDLESMLPPSVKWGDLQADVATAFDDVRRSFPPEGARTWQAIEESAMRLATSYMQAGASKSNAIEKAHKNLIGDQYAVGEFRDVPFLIPRQFDAGSVEDEARRVVEEFEPTPAMIAAPQGRDPSEFIERAKRTFRDEAYWVARGDGKGLRLHLGGRPTPASFTFEQFVESAAKRRADMDTEILRRQREIADDPRSRPGLR